MASKSLSLEKILHKQGFGTRKMCRILIVNEQVSVNGEICDDPKTVFDTEALQFSVNDEPWEYMENSYLMLHKPPHYECTRKTQFHPTVYTLLPKPLVERGVQCIGRLDEDTTGLLLLSDDGQFIHKVSSPKHHVPKIYEVTCKHPLDQSDMDQLLAGVKLVDEELTIAALAVKKISDTVIHMTLGEGKYHQVKRMIAALSNRVVHLKRIQIGNLCLPKDMNPGEWRWLKQNEINCLTDK